MPRTDIHRPSAINPTEYEYVGIEYMRIEQLGDIEAVVYYRKRIRKHMDRTGGTYSTHEHGGNCHVCGAHCIYTALFYHKPTNVYIRTGFDCAEKLGYLSDKEFTSFREAVADARQRKAGKEKASLILADDGLDKAWEIYNWTEDVAREHRAIERVIWKDNSGRYTDQTTFEYRTLKDIIDRLVKYGSVSEKQLAFLHRLITTILNRAEVEEAREAKRKAEHDAAQPVPEGRIKFKGKLLSVRLQDGMHGAQTKGLFVSENGWKVWGTIPASALSHLCNFDVLYYRDGEAKLNREKVAFVEMTATITRSNDDEKFGFYSRPTNPSVWVEENNNVDA